MISFILQGKQNQGVCSWDGLEFGSGPAQGQIWDSKGSKEVLRVNKGV